MVRKGFASFCTLPPSSEVFVQDRRRFESGMRRDSHRRYKPEHVRTFVCEPHGWHHTGCITNRSSNCNASCVLAACQAMGGFFHFAVMLRKTNQMSLVAASSFGK